MSPRDLPVTGTRRALKTADLRGLRRRAGIRAATLAEALGTNIWRIYEWERGRCLPSGRLLASYARVIGGLARHEQVSSDDEEAADAA